MCMALNISSKRELNAIGIHGADKPHRKVCEIP